MDTHWVSIKKTQLESLTKENIALSPKQGRYVNIRLTFIFKTLMKQLANIQFYDCVQQELWQIEFHALRFL